MCWPMFWPISFLKDVGVKPTGNVNESSAETVRPFSDDLLHQ